MRTWATFWGEQNEKFWKEPESLSLWSKTTTLASLFLPLKFYMGSEWNSLSFKLLLLQISVYRSQSEF